MEWLEEKLQNLCNVLQVLDEVLEQEQCFTLQDSAVNGIDIMSFGITGKKIGNILRLLMGGVIDEKLNNEREILLSRVKEVLVS